MAFERKWRRQAGLLAQRRENLDQPGFIAALADVADADIAEWLWDELIPYWEPNLTPHPDDDVLRDLPIDPEEPNDWLDRFCSSERLDRKSFPDWSYGEATTVRNLAAWLAAGRRARTA